MSAELTESTMMTVRVEQAHPIATDIHMFELRHPSLISLDENTGTYLYRKAEINPMSDLRPRASADIALVLDVANSRVGEFN